MKYTVNFIGRNALLLLILVGLVGMSSAYAGGQQATPQNTAKPKPAAQNTMKPKTSTKMAKTRTTRASKKKRHHARRGTATGAKKSTRHS